MLDNFEIVPFQNEFKEDFKSLNVEWISKFFNFLSIFSKKLSFFKNVMFPSFYNYPVFGNYVDKLRGVNFVDGIGFATTAIAEIISGGFIMWSLYILILSYALTILHKAFKCLEISNSFWFTLFFISPIVWGQARGSILQFLFKFIFFILISFVLKHFKIYKIKL